MESKRKDKPNYKIQIRGWKRMGDFIFNRLARLWVEIVAANLG